MKKKLRLNFLLLILMLFSSYTLLSAHGFNGIIPLKSTCEDVKRILKVEKCEFPYSLYFLKDFTISIYYTKEKPSETDKVCYKVPAGRVSSIRVSYNKQFPIKDFEYNVKYAEGPFGDIGTIAYENLEKGVSVFTVDGVVGTAFFKPTLKQHRKFSYSCNPIPPK